MNFFMKMVIANRWLFKTLIFSGYEKSAGGNAMIRTTAVPTILSAGMKDNVIPTVASAVVNFRILPGNTTEDVIAHVKAAINDTRVQVSKFGNFVAEASGVTSEQSLAYKRVEETVRKTFSNTITAPFLMIGGTDSRHFGEVSSGIIKFSPVFDPIGFHGIDERISLEGYQSAVWFYEQLLKHLD
jgi:carboxypeptidase PM20D1